MGHIAFIGIGSNTGEKIRRCEEAISEILKTDRNALLAQSSFFRTKPTGYVFQDWFVNAVVKIETDLEPFPLLRTLKDIEHRLGRVETFRWGPRAIDLDILLFDRIHLQTPELEVPHPMLPFRQFVLVPLAEIEPGLLHPVLNKTVEELAGELEDQGVEKLTGEGRRV
jgi:2-amino-4-hydroxy-6-hydroxymethyldihydropteridine diphosphokinase